jgi:hypothetical protein
MRHPSTASGKEAGIYQGRRHALGRYGRKSDFRELVHVAARAIADLHHLGRQFPRRHGDHTLPGSA